MNSTNPEIGSFVFSLDTEMAWGSLWAQSGSKPFHMDGAKERETIQRLLNIMDEFGVAATWAFTGHLFYEKCEECEICPIMNLKGLDARFDQIWGTADSLWYGADLIEAVLTRNAGHEIACHGYTHKLFDTLSREEASFEIQEWVRLAKRKGIIQNTIIFPQGRIGHLDLFREAGFICYRGREVRHPALSIPFLGKLLNQINLRFSNLPPQVYEVQLSSQGLVNIPSSQWLFRFDRRIEKALDSLELQNLRFRATITSIEKAALEGKVLHLWAHPHEFQTEKDFQKLRFIFSKFAERAREGRLRSITMQGLAIEKLKKLSQASGIGK